MLWRVGLGDLLTLKDVSTPIETFFKHPALQCNPRITEAVADSEAHAQT